MQLFLMLHIMGMVMVMVMVEKVNIGKPITQLKNITIVEIKQLKNVAFANESKSVSLHLNQFNDK